MKYVVALMLVAVAAGAVSGSIVSSFPSPAGTDMAFGIEHYNPYIYHLVSFGGYSRTVITDFSGSVMGSFPNPRDSWPTMNPSDLDVGTDGVWYTSGGAGGYVFHYSPAGSFLSSFPAAAGGGGIARDANYVYLSRSTGVEKYTPAGSIVYSIAYPQQTIYAGFDIQGNDFWFGATWNGSYYVARGTTTGSIVEQFNHPGLPAYLRGCTWDGHYLWVVSAPTVDNYWVYRLTTADTEISPCSLGRVKAIYR